jgi:hypothetical protein
VALPCCFVLSLLPTGCEPTVVIGLRTCEKPGATTDAGTNADAGAPGLIALPWSTGFETGFCDFSWPEGLCYSTGSASFELAEAPVHSGRFSAAFHVLAVPDAGSVQARCYRQGVLPKAARYGAWYYLPAAATNTGVWNLFHFQGGPDFDSLTGLWDVSVVNGDAGALQLVVWGFGLSAVPAVTGVPPLPIETWFHLEFVLVRAADATGKVELFLDGVQGLSASAIVTDVSNSAVGQFYVGNYATAMAPPNSTVYVDDITITSP